jgi:hypothetical protein
MFGRRLRWALVCAVLGILVAKAVAALRGSPAPVFSRHPVADGGGRPPGNPAPPAVSTAPPAVAPATTASAEGAEPKVRMVPTTGPPETTVEAPAWDAPMLPMEQTWREPADGVCPDGYPVKAKLRSGIYHLPGMIAYQRTTPDRCYPTPEAAAADGLRAAKR